MRKEFFGFLICIVLFSCVTGNDSDELDKLDEEVSLLAGIQKVLREINLLISTDSNADCLCENGRCEKNERGEMKCVCLPEYGIFSKTKCKPCYCGKAANCTIIAGWLKDEIKCICPEGIKKGKNNLCEDPCDSSPCQNGGICDISYSGVKCDCISSYTGKFCEIEISTPGPTSDFNWTDKPTNDTEDFDETSDDFPENINQTTYEPYKYTSKQTPYEIFNFTSDFYQTTYDPFDFNKTTDEPFNFTFDFNNTTDEPFNFTFDFNKTTDEPFNFTFDFNKTTNEPFNFTFDFNQTTYEPYNYTSEQTPYEIFNFTSDFNQTTYDPFNFTFDFNKTTDEPFNFTFDFNKTTDESFNFTFDFNQTTYEPYNYTSKQTPYEIFNFTFDFNQTTYDPFNFTFDFNKTTDDPFNFTFEFNQTTGETFDFNGTSVEILNFTMDFKSTTELPDLNTTSDGSTTPVRISSKIPGCNCGIKSIACKLNSKGNKECLCLPGFSQLNDSCTDCYCGQYSSACYFDFRGRKTCICENGFGQRNESCSISCEGNSECLNGGICKLDISGKGFCSCINDYTGDRCEFLDSCKRVEANCRRMGAVCRVVNEKPSCECPPEKIYDGDSGRCKTICSVKTCFRGRCEIFGRSYKCRCDEGYSGTHCDVMAIPLERAELDTTVFILLAGFVIVFSSGVICCTLVYRKRRKSAPAILQLP